MNRYLVVLDSSVAGGCLELYVMAYSVDHVKDIFADYTLAVVDQTD